MENGRAFHWAITLKDTDKLIGGIDLRPNSEENRGFWLASAYQGKDIMKEAVLAINDFAFDKLKMPELKLKNAEPNIASHHIKELSGASIVGIDEKILFVGGYYRNVRWNLTPSQWTKNRHRFLQTTT
jgi:ribosomal-protein-alanine N-acetyltransferase